MPWRGPRYEGEYPTLGWGVLAWGFRFLPSPRDATQPFRLTDEQAQLTCLWYSIDPQTGRFPFRRAIVERAKGWGKSPVVGFWQLAELGASTADDSAPVIFDGWDANGEPVGRPWGTRGSPPALVQILAVSEDQTENTYGAIYQLLTANDHRAARDLGIDDGRTALRLIGRPGQLVPMTASSASREGAPTTSAVLDETHLYYAENGGHKLAAVARRNVGKMGGRTVETTNAPLLGRNSVAERSGNAAMRGASGILYDAKRPTIAPEPEWTDSELRKGLEIAYGDAHWVDLDRLIAEIRDPDNAWDDSLRFYFNVRLAGSGRAVDPREWDALAMPRELPRGTHVGLGFDGSVSDDSTFLRGCTRTGYSFLIGSWIAPTGDDLKLWQAAHPGQAWSVNRLEVKARLDWAFEYFVVGRLVMDPPKWWTERDAWTLEYGLGSDGQPRVESLDTNQHQTRFSEACDRWFTSIRESTAALKAAKGLIGPLELPYCHDGDPATTEHVKAAHLKKIRPSAAEDDGRTRYVIVKGEDRRKIDGAVAEVLARYAAATMPDSPKAKEPLVAWRSRRRR